MSIETDINREMGKLLTRRHFFGLASAGIGAAALGSLMNTSTVLAAPAQDGLATKGALPRLHFPAKAKRVIYLHQNGAPSQIDLFDYKPKLREMHGQELPGSVRMGQRLTGMTSGQDSFPLTSSIFDFKQCGGSGMWISDVLPHTQKIADDICLIKTVNTEAINHDPAVTYVMTGHQQPGRPSIGSWISYGLGSENENLPAFIVLISLGSGKTNMQPLFARLWGSGFLPSQHQGVNLRSGADPVLYLNNPPGIDGDSRRMMLDGLAELNQIAEQSFHDPEISTRIAQYEMAYRMQTSVPELMDIRNEPESVLKSYGENVTKPGTFAANCLLARRLAERGVRFIQLYHRGWDQHGNLPNDLKSQCYDTDQPSAALVQDLKERGMLDDTLVIWGGEFGRTVYCQGKLEKNNYGRDHHGRCFSLWMAGAGVKPGMTFGETDDFSYNIVKDPVHVHDLNATVLHQLGVNHEQLTYRFQGRDFRLTDVHGRVVTEILA